MVAIFYKVLHSHSENSISGTFSTAHGTCGVGNCYLIQLIRNQTVIKCIAQLTVFTKFVGYMNLPVSVMEFLGSRVFLVSDKY